MNGYKLAECYDGTGENGLYWTDGKKVYFQQNYEVKGADIASFLSYDGFWACDKKSCYSGTRRLRDADSESFEVLNYAYAKDKNSVRTMGGRIKDADAESFAVCDDGKHYWFLIISTFNGKEYIRYAPLGFGKDKNYVYHCDMNGKVNICRNAAPDAFVSLNNGSYGFDDNHVFCANKKLNKADPKNWKLIKDGYHYSKDKFVYFLNRTIKGADAETFEVMGAKPELFDSHIAYLSNIKKHLARDKNNFYLSDIIVDEKKWNSYLKKI